MSSIVHYMGAREGIRWSTINNGDEALAVAARKKLGMARLNGQSRLVGLRFRCGMTRDDLNRRPKGNILFSNELARRYDGEGIVSISLFPGAVNADLSGYATSFVKRVRRMLGACIWFILSAGDLEALTEEMGPHSMDAAGRPATTTTQNANTHDARDNLENAEDRLSELANSPLRAITSLYAGTDPEAGKLNGKVRYPISPKSRLEYRPTDVYHLLPSISPPGLVSHFHIGRHSTESLEKSCGTGAKNRSKISRPRSDCHLTHLPSAEFLANLSWYFMTDFLFLVC
jgi:hypothetical protein